MTLLAEAIPCTNLDLSVTLALEVIGSHSTRAKKFSFSSSLDLQGHYMRQPTDIASRNSTKVSRLKRAAGQN